MSAGISIIYYNTWGLIFEDFFHMKLQNNISKALIFLSGWPLSLENVSVDEEWLVISSVPEAKL